MTSSLKQQIPGDVLLSESQIKERISALAKQISADYKGQSFIALIVLQGSFIFAADLLRNIEGEVQIDFVGLRSYGDSTESSRSVTFTKKPSLPLKGANILIIEDIVDTGHSMDFLLRWLAEQQPSSVKIASFLHKPSREEISIAVEYVGFSIEDHFVVGYGLDFAQKYRHLPDVRILRKSHLDPISHS